MFSAQFMFGLIFGAASVLFICGLAAPLIWRLALAAAGKAARNELPLSLKEVAADRDFLRAKQAVALCRAEEDLAREQAGNYARKLALGAARERLSQTDALAEQCRKQQAELTLALEKNAKLAAQNHVLREKAQASLKLKQADLTRFRRQIKEIAAQTAGLIAAGEGADSPILRLVKADEQEAEAQSRAGTAKKADLAAAIAAAAETALAARQKRQALGAAETAPETARKTESEAAASAPQIAADSAVIRSAAAANPAPKSRAAESRSRKAAAKPASAAKKPKKAADAAKNSANSPKKSA